LHRSHQRHERKISFRGTVEADAISGHATITADGNVIEDDEILWPPERINTVRKHHAVFMLSRSFVRNRGAGTSRVKTRQIEHHLPIGVSIWFGISGILTIDRPRLPDEEKPG
jgi:hypothetical protein